MDEDRVGDPAPFPHEPRARLQRDRRRGFNRAAAQRVGASSLQLPCGGLREAAVRPLLKLVTDPSGQEVAGEPHRRRHAMKPAPLSASSKMVNAESRANAFAISIAALSMSASAPRFDAIAANAVVGLLASFSPSTFFSQV